MDKKETFNYKILDTKFEFRKDDVVFFKNNVKKLLNSFKNNEQIKDDLLLYLTILTVATSSAQELISLSDPKKYRTLIRAMNELKHDKICIIKESENDI